MKIVTLESLSQQYQLEQKEAKENRKNLKDNSKKIIESIFNPNVLKRKGLVLERKGIRHSVMIHDASSSILGRQLNSLCTLDLGVALTFSSKVLTEIEGQNFEHFDLTHSSVFARITLEYSYIITTLENYCALYNDFSSYYSDIAEKCIPDKKYVLLEDVDSITEPYSLYSYSEGEVPQDLTENFPYLEQIIIDFINFRILHPDLTVQQLISKFLEELPTNYSEQDGNLIEFGEIPKRLRLDMSIFDKKVYLRRRALKKIRKERPFKIAEFICKAQNILQDENYAPANMSPYDGCDPKKNEQISKKIILIAPGKDVSVLSDLCGKLIIRSMIDLNNHVSTIHHLILERDGYELFNAEDEINRKLYQFNPEFENIVNDLINMLIENPSLLVEEAMERVLARLPEKQKQKAKDKI